MNFANFFDRKIANRTLIPATIIAVLKNRRTCFRVTVFINLLTATIAPFLAFSRA